MTDSEQRHDPAVYVYACCQGLHDMRDLKIVESAAHHGDQLMKGMFDCVGYTMMVPHADEPCKGMNVGMEKGSLYIDFQRGGREVKGVDDAYAVTRDHHVRRIRHGGRRLM